VRQGGYCHSHSLVRSENLQGEIQQRTGEANFAAHPFPGVS
jgi:hypothetical protein